MLNRCKQCNARTPNKDFCSVMCKQNYEVQQRSDRNRRSDDSPAIYPHQTQYYSTPTVIDTPTTTTPDISPCGDGGGCCGCE